MKNAFEGCKFGCECSEGDEFKGKGEAPLVVAGSVEPSESTLMRCEPKPKARRSTRIFDEHNDVILRSDKVKDIKEEKKPEARLSALGTIYPEGINGVKGDEGYSEVLFAVDSGATETVMSDGMLDTVDTTEGKAYKQGVQYEVANGLRIPNLGEEIRRGDRGRIQEEYDGTSV